MNSLVGGYIGCLHSWVVFSLYLTIPYVIHYLFMETVSKLVEQQVIILDRYCDASSVLVLSTHLSFVILGLGPVLILLRSILAQRLMDLRAIKIVMGLQHLLNVVK